MKKLAFILALMLVIAMSVVACNTGDDTGEPPVSTDTVTDAPTTEQPTEAPTTEEPTTEQPTEAPSAEPTTEETTQEPTEAPTTEEPTTEAPAAPVEPTAYYSAEALAAMTPANATVALVDGYAHFLTGTADNMTNPSITLTAEGEGYSDIIVIKYRTNCGTYGSNYWGTLLLNGTEEFNGNRKDSDNWFYYATDGSWNVLIMDMRKNKQGSSGIPDTDLTGGAAITSVVYNFFDYTGNDGKLATADGGEEYIDIAYIAFFNTKADAAASCE
ncbi:MAG: hypothetical protein IIW17_01270 [Clostridia bacterium]|nr:hypothetical protein [Clostridia bacterium]